MMPSPEVITKLKYILEKYFVVSNHAIMYSEVVTGEAMEKGIIEFRDALAHIYRALNSNDEKRHWMI